MLHAGDESSVGAMGRNPMTFSRRGPLKACFSPGLCPIGVGVLQDCAPLKLHVISLWGSLWCVACFSPGVPVVWRVFLQACAPLKLHVILVSYVGLV